MRATIALAAALALGGCAAKVQTAALPPGTYRYDSHEGGIAAQSTVTVSAEPGAIVVRERARLRTYDGPVIESRLDPKTYSLESYSVTQDPEGENPTIAVSSRAPSFAFGNWMSSFVALPSLVRVTGAKTIQGYVPELVRKENSAKTFYVVAAQAPAPPGAHSGDASLALAWHPRDKPVITLWYDPATFVVDAVNFGGAPGFVRL